MELYDFICTEDDNSLPTDTDDPIWCGRHSPDRFVTMMDFDDWSKGENSFGWTEDFDAGTFGL